MTISRQEMAELRQSYGIVENLSYSNTTNTITFDEAVQKCHQYIKYNASSAYRSEKNSVKKDNMQRILINDFVDKKAPKVDRFFGTQTNFQDLKTALYNNIVGYGQLTPLMEPADQKDSRGYQIDEIRINDRSNIWIEKNGKAEQTDLVLSELELETLTARLLEHSKKILAAGTPIQNARTKEGYRVNLVYGGVSHGKDTVGVIRKFNSKPMTARQLIKGKTLSVNMFKTLKLIVDSDSSFVVVGATGSGKTVTNGIILRNIKNNVRLFSIENPVELPLKKVNRVTGRVMNDVVQYEAQSASDSEGAIFTVEKAIETALRQSPHWLILGEARTEHEFVAALTAGQTGHCFATTYHAESVLDALKRYLTAYMKVSKEPANLAMANICASLRFVISQQKLPDGTRKIVEIAEIFPPKDLESVTPRINMLYEFITDEIVYDEQAMAKGDYIVKEMRGSHHRINPLSEENQKRWVQRGVSKDRFEFLTKPVEKDKDGNFTEIERYTIEESDFIPED